MAKHYLNHLRFAYELPEFRTPSSSKLVLLRIISHTELHKATGLVNALTFAPKHAHLSVTGKVKSHP